MRRKYLLIPAVLLSMTMLSSCSLLPEEEEVRTAPLLRATVSETFELALVERGDLTLSEKISCRYVPVQSASLAFTMTGEYIDKMTVQPGDAVTAGQLLGQLQLDDLEERIADAESAVAELELQLAHLGELYELELRRCELRSEGLEPEEKQELLDAVEEDFLARRTSLQDALTLQRLTLDTLQDELSERQIRAPFDGTVTYVKEYKEGALSANGETAVTIADSTMSLFRAETTLWSSFHPGDEYDITVSRTAYPAVVTEAEALGLEPQERVEGEKAYVYFALKEPTFELEEGDRGTVELIIEEYTDVLHVPSETVSSAGGQAIVYYKREDGMKAYKPVEIGPTVNKRTIILGGLTEGESIIAN